MLAVVLIDQAEHLVAGGVAQLQWTVDWRVVATAAVECLVVKVEVLSVAVGRAVAVVAVQEGLYLAWWVLEVGWR